MKTDMARTDDELADCAYAWLMKNERGPARASVIGSRIHEKTARIVEVCRDHEWFTLRESKSGYSVAIAMADGPKRRNHIELVK